MRCVTHFIEVEGVDPTSLSNTHAWSALNFAAWARQQGVVGAEEVETYMRFLTDFSSACPASAADPAEQQ